MKKKWNRLLSYFRRKERKKILFHCFYYCISTKKNTIDYFLNVNYFIDFFSKVIDFHNYQMNDINKVFCLKQEIRNFVSYQITNIEEKSFWSGMAALGIALLLADRYAIDNLTKKI